MTDPTNPMVRRALITSIDDTFSGIQVREVERSALRPGEARVTMAWAPINPADLLLASGRHLFRPTLPAPIGIEGSGIVQEVAADVGAELVGRKVTVPFGGTWSEEMVAPAADLLLLPDETDLEQASMLAVNPFTAWGLTSDVPQGSVLLQNAASSAVGRLVIRLAKLRGLTTANIVRREEEVAPLRALGADLVLVGEHDLAARISATLGAPVLRALDAVAGTGSGSLLSALAEGGDLVCYGLLSDDRIVLPANEVVFRDVTVRGYSRFRSWRAMSVEARAEMTRTLVALLEEGAITTSVEARYPLSRLHDALTHALRSGRAGKILLQP
jgi:mitochondrial enoyl-[acyl-carrier protein] reductase / trans-2-enoyl-CoA reductase